MKPYLELVDRRARRLGHDGRLEVMRGDCQKLLRTVCGVCAMTDTCPIISSLCAVTSQGVTVKFSPTLQVSVALNGGVAQATLVSTGTGTAGYRINGQVVNVPTAIAEDASQLAQHLAFVVCGRKPQILLESD